MDALSAVIANRPTRGPKRAAHFLLEQLLEHARQSSIDMPFSATPATSTPSSPDQEERCPGNLEIEGRLRARALERDGHGKLNNRHHPVDGGISGGHIGSFARWPTCSVPASTTSGTPRARTTAATASTSRAMSRRPASMRAPIFRAADRGAVDNFRQEVDGGLSSYPHPKLMPEFWQFPTVSMGLGPLMAIHQARFLKYLHARGLAHTGPAQGLGVLRRRRNGRGRKRWARSAWPRAKNLDNLVFVINCNLQRLDGGARQRQDHPGTGSEFRGSGWNVIQADLGSNWDPLLARDKDGVLRKIMMDNGRRRPPNLQDQRRRLRAQSISSARTRARSRWCPR